MTFSEPAEEQNNSIKVRLLYRSNREVLEVQSISEAIQVIKDKNTKLRLSCSKIEENGDIVFNSDRNGNIEDWENEWKRQKKVLSVEQSPRNCPHGHDNCFDDDLCLPCQMDAAAESA